MRPAITAVCTCGLMLASLAFAQPDEAQALYNKGVQYLGEGKPFDAADAFTAAIAKRPGFAEAFCGQGDAYSRTSRYPLAIVSYTQAIKFKPGYAAALSGRGFAHYFAEQYESSETDFVAAIKADVTKADTIVSFLFGELGSFRANLKGK